MRALLIIATLVFTTSVFAAEGEPSQKKLRGPDEMIREVTQKVLERVEKERKTLKENPQEIYELVDNQILPHLDFRYMSQLVMARYWRDATDKQKERFVKAFKDLLIRTYSNALLGYENQKLEFEPYRGPKDAGDARVTMKIKPSDGPAIPVTFATYQTDDGRWLIYDVSVEGVSLVTNYRSTFATELKRNGIDSLIGKIRTKDVKSDFEGKVENERK